MGERVSVCMGVSVCVHRRVFTRMWGVCTARVCMCGCMEVCIVSVRTVYEGICVPVCARNAVGYAGKRLGLCDV